MARVRRGERIPPELAERVALLYREGRSLKEIAGELPVSRSGAGRLLERMGIPKRARGGGRGLARPQTRIPPDLEREVVRLYTAEYRSLREISEALPLSAMAASYALRRNGVRLRPRSWGNRNRHLPQVAVARVVGAVEGGQTVAQAAESLGLTRGAVYSRLKMAGVTPPTRPRVTRERVSEARRLVRSTGSVRGAAEAMGVSGQTVRNYLRRG